jgi:MFS family permease
MSVTSYVPIFIHENFPDMNAKQIGTILSAWQFSFAFWPIPLGILLHKIGRKNALIFGVILACIATVLYALFSYVKDPTLFFWMNFVARFIEGIADATLVVSLSAIIAIEFPDNTEKYFGIMHFALAAGMTLGPIICAPLYTMMGYDGAFYFLTGVIGVVGLIGAIFVVPSRINDSLKSHELD